jgi:hypothetical protein
VIAAVGREEQRHGLTVGGRAVRQRVLAEQQLSQQATDGPRARLARRVRAAAAGLEVGGEPSELRRRARAVDALEHDEDGGRMGDRGGHLRRRILPEPRQEA